MTRFVLDASALLAYLQNEKGGDRVRSALVEGSTCGAANWSEVAHKIIRARFDWSTSAALVHSFDIEVEPVTIDDAERAAEIWRNSPTLSLADRLCIALGERLDVTVLTADSAFGSKGRIEQIR